MLNEPLVTIIVPFYNNERYIEDCLKSLLNQTYKNLQIILVNDGSSDSTYEICKRYKDNRILLLSKENGGASSARNMGLEYADGDYIYFADSDDYLEHNAIEVLVKEITSNNGNCVFFEANNYAENEKQKAKKGGLLQKNSYEIQNGDELLPKLLSNKDYHAAPFLYFVERTIYDGLRFEEGIMFEDELFTFLMLRKCKRVISLRQQLYHRRVREGSVMTSTGKEVFRFDSITKVYEELFKEYSIKCNDKLLSQYLVRIALLWFCYWKAMSKNEKNNRLTEYESVRNQILSNKGFDSRELVVRCYGYYLWLIYIIPNRMVKKIKRRRL